MFTITHLDYYARELVSRRTIEKNIKPSVRASGSATEAALTQTKQQTEREENGRPQYDESAQTEHKHRVMVP